MSGAVGVVGFVAVGGLMFGLDQSNWAAATEKPGFVSLFCEGHCPADAPVTECSCHGDAALFPSDYSWFFTFGTAILQAGAAVGALAVAPIIAGRLGRRETMFAGAIVTAVGIILSTCVQTYATFLTARFVAGVGVGCVTYALPMYIAEVAPVQIRGILGSMMQLSCATGQVLACLITMLPISYGMSFALPAFPAIIVALGIFFFPESPRFTLLKFKRLQQPDQGVAQAKESLRRLRGNEVEADKELFELQQALDVETKEAPWSTLFLDKSIFKRVLIANFLQWGQQFTGVNAILSQGPAMFIDAGVTFTGDKVKDGLIATTFVNATILCSVIAVMFAIDVYGRRFLLLLGGVIMTISMTVAAILGKMIYDMEDDPTMADTRTTYGYMLVAAVCCFALGYGPWGTIPWVYPSEIFPMDVKEKGMTTSCLSQWVGNCVIAFLVFPFERYLLTWGTLAFYAVSCGVVLVLVALTVPEIKGVRMEDMESVFGARKTAPQERLAEA
jgi:sugar porter (SP) family MFS transporter